MKHTFHCHLRKSFSWYNGWHNHPRHHHLHWSIFLVIIMSAVIFISGQINNLNFEHSSLSDNLSFITSAEAQSLAGRRTNGPPYGTQGDCDDGFIVLGEASASTADPTISTNWFCDEDPGEDRAGGSVTQLNYPVTGRLYCSSGNNGHAFIVNGQTPCNCRPRPGGVCGYDPALPLSPFGQANVPINWPGWEFIGGRPHLLGNSVNLIADRDCNAGDDFTVVTVQNVHSYGAWREGGAVRGYVCIRGTDLTKLPRYIYFFINDFAPAGENVEITGENLAPDIHFTSATGVITTITGSVHSSQTKVNFIVPSNLPAGIYGVTVGANLTSNSLKFIITEGFEPPIPTGTEQPNIIRIVPNTINQGGSIEIIGEFLTEDVQFTDINGLTYTFIGTLSSDERVTTVIMPDALLPGPYNVTVLSPNGSTTALDTLTIIEGRSQIDPLLENQSVPTASEFDDLIGSAFNYAIIFVGLSVFIMILYAGFLWMTSAANPGNISTAKKMISNAILGAILLLSSYVILYTINPELVGGRFDIQGIEIVPFIPDPVPPPPPTGGNIDACQSCTAYPGRTTSTYQRTLRCVGAYENLTQGTGIGLNNSGVTCPYGVSEMRLRLANLKNRTDNAGVSWLISEGFPPTVNHSSSQHSNGQAVDIVLTPAIPAQSSAVTVQMVQQLDKLCVAIREAEFRTLINEYAQIPVSLYSSMPNCENPTSFETTTGGHLHLGL